MSYATHATEAEALAFVATCDSVLGLPKAGDPPAPHPFGWTLTWAVPRKHPTLDLWAVEIPAGVTPPVSGVLDSLDASWNPADGIGGAP